MFSLLIVILAGIGTYLVRGTDAFYPAIAFSVVCFWSQGVLVNYMRDPWNCPGGVQALAGLTTLLSPILLAYGIWGSDDLQRVLGT